jgi:hypothetical protein
MAEPEPRTDSHPMQCRDLLGQDSQRISAMLGMGMSRFDARRAPSDQSLSIHAAVSWTIAASNRPAP